MKVPGVCFGFDVEKLGGGWPDQQCCQPLQNAKEPTGSDLLEAKLHQKKAKVVKAARSLKS